MLEYCRIAVNETPRCFWGYNLREKNIRYLERLDSDFYDKIAIKLAKLHEEDPADIITPILIRQYYYQSLETLYSFIFALLQSPDCVFGWLSMYKTSQLKKLVEKINCGRKILSKFKFPFYDWDHISELVHVAYAQSEKKESLIKCYSLFWQRLSYEYLKDDYNAEYNSLKHGARIMPGGVFISIGRETTPGKAAPKENMKSIGGSKYGTTFYSTEKILNDTDENKELHWGFKEKTVNWLPEALIPRLQLISNSINNIISATLIYNGKDPNKVLYKNPQDLNAFDESYFKTPGVLGLNRNIDVSREEIIEHNLSEKEILEEYEEK